MGLNMSIMWVELCHEGHVRLLLLMQVLLSLNCLLFPQLTLIRIIGADRDDADLFR